MDEVLPLAELSTLLRLHGSYTAIARVFGVSRWIVRARCRQLGLKSPARRTGRLCCGICGMEAHEGRVLRFQLHANPKPGEPNGAHAGSVDLCETCWRRVHVRHHRRMVAAGVDDRRPRDIRYPP